MQYIQKCDINKVGKDLVTCQKPEGFMLRVISQTEKETVTI